MRISLKKLVIFNFKSFQGKHVIGPIMPFTSITGRNGSGKSNIMDAIRFALGEKPSLLRVRCLDELIYGAPIEQPATDGTYVTIILALDDNIENSFTRTIYAGGNQYKIDDRIVNSNIYKAQLREFGLNINVRNFLVPQNYISNFAIKTPKEQIAMFEEISGSHIHKADYDKLKLELLNAEEEIHFISQKKRQILMQKTSAIAEKAEAEKYLQLQEQYMKENLRLQSGRLLLVKKAIELLQCKEKEIKSCIDIYQRDKEFALLKLHDVNLRFKKISDKADSIEHDIFKMEDSICEKKMKIIALEDSSLHWKETYDHACASLDSANIEHESKRKTIQELNDNLEQIQKLKATIITECTVELDELQWDEYKNLKNKAEVKVQKFIKQINNLMPNYQSNRDKFDFENSRKKKIEDKINQSTLMKKDLEMRLTKLETLNADCKPTLTERKVKRQELNDKIIETKNMSLNLEKNIASISQELQQSEMHNHTVLQQTKKVEIMRMLKQLFSGVHDRLSNLCKPCHPRYNIAVTKAFGKNMDAIVVDTMYTAVQCIEVLKQQEIGIEIFLPLDSIKTVLLKEHLRTENVKLLYDVLNISSAQINKAVLFACKNTLVCETAEDARRTAYKLDRNNRYDCVSLDGCFYRKSGIMSGGEVDLIARAKQWEQKDILALLELKTQLKQTLENLPKISLLQSEFDNINMQINGLNSKNKYIENEIKDIKNEIDGECDNLSALNGELSALNSILSSLQHKMEERDNEIRAIESNVDAIKNETFANFCKSINIPNISYYEKNLCIHKEQKKRQLELEVQIDLIKQQITFEKECNTEDKISKWKRAVKAAKIKLNESHKKEQSEKIATKDEEMKMLKLKEDYTDIQRILEEVEKELVDHKSQIGVVNNLYFRRQKTLIITQEKIKQGKAEFNTILKKCKMEDITIPILLEQSHHNLSFSSISMNSPDLNSESLSDSHMFARIDFSKFPKEILNCTEEELESIVQELEEKLLEIQKEYEAIANPNLKAGENVDLLAQQLRKINQELRNMRQKYNDIKKRFEIIKAQRYKLFSDCLEHVAADIDSIFKILFNDTLAQAFILSDNPEEPYAGSLIYSCMLPFKCFQPIQYLSGGEKSLASLALLFAFQRCKSTPFFILDEADAELDNINIKNLVRFIRSENTTQFIAITLKKKFYSYTDTLVGVATVPKTKCPTSRIFCISLKEYETKI